MGADKSSLPKVNGLYGIKKQTLMKGSKKQWNCFSPKFALGLQVRV
ncbi:hypothetical protein P872_14570 [Rhodonellum psychrophilum GCM71 = DSM 17998]|uniref:Uncharacterized protein n=1 Tax=Rhodonellum psychrophilum GCM71 = DSM 17998 TaxID=1123057 RepID=U5C7T4_9BACT|nr:hypothetical protein P872_14570 [Rhodonellum psychrophilum GCM71 = DSM 17998]